MTELNDTITLIDEEGVEHEFEVEAFLEVENQKYAVLVPLETDEADDEEEAILLRFGQDENGEEILMDIEDDEEWERVADAYDAFAAEEYGEE